MKQSIIFPVMLVIILTLFVTCTTLEQLIQPPQVKVETINIADFSFSDITLEFGLLVNNPNAFAVDLEGYTYQLAIEGKEMLSADENRSLTINSAEKSMIKLPVKVNFKKVFELAKDSRNLDSLSYELTGNLKPGGLLSAFSLPFRRAGQVPNIRIPDVSLAHLRIKKMNLSGIELETRLNITNVNAFAFDVGKLNYALELANNSVARGTMNEGIKIPAKGKGEITIPLSLDFGGALGSLRSLLSGNQISTTIKGDAQMGTPLGDITLPFDITRDVPLLR